MTEQEQHQPPTDTASLDQAIIQGLFAVIDDDIEIVEWFHEAEDARPRDLFDEFAKWRNSRITDALADRLHDVLGEPHARHRSDEPHEFTPFPQGDRCTLCSRPGAADVHVVGVPA